MRDDGPIALRAFEALAERFSTVGERKPENAYIEQPCMRQLIGEAQGLRILDAGCGPGILAQYLAERGAQVTGFDISPRMIDFAQARLGDKANFYIADLARPLEFAQAGSFDMVV